MAKAVLKASNCERNFKFLYDLNLSIEDKIRTIAKEIYRANDIEISSFAQERIDLFKKQVVRLNSEFFKILKNFVLIRALMIYQSVWQKLSIHLVINQN